MRKLLFLPVMCSLVQPSYSHSWYPWECCSYQDCWPMGEDTDSKEPDPKIVPGGYLTHDGHFVPEAQTRPSRDGRYHVCRKHGSLKGEVIQPSGKPQCLFVPFGGS